MTGEKNERTKWEGLWFNRQGVYSGQIIVKKDIPKRARLIIRYNRYYEAGSKRPKFIYCFAQTEAAKQITLEREFAEIPEDEE